VTIIKKDIADKIIIFVAVLIFSGTWIEAAVNTGLAGVAIGWIPGVTIAYMWLLLFGKV